MSNEDPPRSTQARAAAELALVRVVHHYGQRPEFVLLGGLVPALLCAGSPRRHAGTTDVDVQVNLEIAGGSVHAARLEQALRNAEFSPDNERVWRWNLRDPAGLRATVKFELLADLDTQLAKAAAAHGRHKPKDWYDTAFVLLHNDHGDAHTAAARVREVFGIPTGAVRTQLLDLQANFDGASTQGTSAYVDQLTLDHPDVDPVVAAADAQLAVAAFTGELLSRT